MYRLLVPRSNLQRVVGRATSNEEQKKQAAATILCNIFNFMFPRKCCPGVCTDPRSGVIPGILLKTKGATLGISLKTKGGTLGISLKTNGVTLEMP